MQVYKLLVTKTKYGFLIQQPDFNLAIDVDTIENGINAMKNQIEQEGVLRLRNGESIPEPKIDMDFIDPDVSAIFVQVDIEKKFKDSATESVRKNISMPAWMDIQLRYHHVDASKLFQDAALEYLENKKQTKTEYKNITTVEELQEHVSADVLNEYIMSLLQR